MRETELKLSVHASFVVPQELDPDLGLQLAPGPELDLRATYYDAEDLRLARNGVTLRHRAGEGAGRAWTLKLPVEEQDLTSRDEYHFAGTPTTVPEEARDLITAYLRNASLSPVARLTTKRRIWWVLDAAGDTCAEIDDDEVSILEGRRVVARFREIEVESKGASLLDLNAISGVLVEAGAMPAEPIPKAVRALGPRATADPDLPAVPKADGDDPAGRAVRAALITGVRRMIAHDPPTRLGHEEGVHQMRVAARRLRSDLKTFSVLVDAQWAAGISDELRWLADSLGRVRDLDVLRIQLSAAATDLEDDCQGLFTALEGQHRDATENLKEVLRSDRYKDLLDLLIGAAREPLLTPEAGTAARAILPGLVDLVWRRLAKRGRALTFDSPDDGFHETRIHAKRARYAAEAVSEVLSDQRRDAKRFAKLAARVQDVLGIHQDTTIAREVIEQHARLGAATAEEEFALGRLYERQVHEAERRRAEFLEVWDELDRKRNTRWMAS